MEAAKAQAQKVEADGREVRATEATAGASFPAGVAGELASALWKQRAALAVDFNAFVGIKPAQLYRACQALHPEVARRLVALTPTSLHVTNKAVTEALLAGWAPLTHQDWKKSTAPPDVGYVYLIAVTMTARLWVAEANRVLVAGESSSRTLGGDLPLGWRIVCAEALAVANSALAASGGADDPVITALYVGQERRTGVKTRFNRVWEHGTKAGNGNVAQLRFFTSRMTAGRECMPAGAVTVQRRTLAMLPLHDAAVINIAEAVCMAAALFPGAVWLNDSPTGDAFGIRFLGASWGGHPPKFISQALATLESRRRKGMAAALPESEPSYRYVMRRALVAGDTLLARHHFGADGTPTPPRLATTVDGARVMRYSWLQCFDAVEGELEGGGCNRRQHVVLWCNACGCGYAAGLCKHVMLARIAYACARGARGARGAGAARAVPTLWRDAELALYADVDTVVLPPPPPAPGAPAAAAAAAAVASAAEAAAAAAAAVAAAAASAAAQMPAVVDLFALLHRSVVQHCTGADLVAYVDKVVTFTKGVVKDFRLADTRAAPAPGGVAAFAPRATSAAQVSEQHRRAVPLRGRHTVASLSALLRQDVAVAPAAGGAGAPLHAAVSPPAAPLTLDDGGAAADTGGAAPDDAAPPAATGSDTDDTDDTDGEGAGVPPPAERARRGSTPTTDDASGEGAGAAASAVGAAAAPPADAPAPSDAVPSPPP